MLSAETLAAQYISGEAVDPTAGELNDFVNWVNDRFERIARYVQFTPDEVTPDVMEETWDQYAILLITTAHNEHPYFEADINAKFRAIHDWDHIHGAFGFNLAGELAAAGYAMSTAPESIRWILWSEVALQAAAAIHTGEFQPQKLVKQCDREQLTAGPLTLTFYSQRRPSNDHHQQVHKGPAPAVH